MSSHNFAVLIAAWRYPSFNYIKKQNTYLWSQRPTPLSLFSSPGEMRCKMTYNTVKCNLVNGNVLISNNGWGYLDTNDPVERRIFAALRGDELNIGPASISIPVTWCRK